MKVMMWQGDDSCMTKLGTSECNSPPPTSNSLGSYYLIIVWRYFNLSMCPIKYILHYLHFFNKNQTIKVQV